ncbi:DUF2478 domain-containing protein [Oryzibacter oryziterrae]|uniref:DUF2478 domain-containing protein n=1 Tax=Oryzibacter oryziterrae TaxID=2766474 RepID=UPI001F1DAF23|nr:DUF2478 domain-containing protein [Oryzibacter oryziterrae]
MRSAGLPIAAIVYPEGSPVDDLLADAVARMRTAGVRVAGFLQAHMPTTDQCCGAMLLTDIEDGTQIDISQKLGPLSSSCKLDSAALAEAASRLDRIVASRPDLLLINRFGKAEVEGRGLRSGIEQAILGGVPVLLSVRADYAVPFQVFHGGLGEILPADIEEVLRWCRTATGLAGLQAAE